MKTFIDIIKSFFQLTFKIILAPKAQVLFYYPQHFNRSAEGTNPFFDPLLKTCEKHNIKYKLIEEPDWGTDKPRNRQAIKGDYFFVVVLTLRKIIDAMHKKDSFTQNEKKVAFFINILTLGQFRFAEYISISGSMEPLFLELNKQAKVFEVQHGIDYSNKSSYFENGQLFEAYRNDHWHLLSFGEGYRKCVIQGHEDELASRVHIIGCPLTLTSNDILTKEEKVVVFSLQFTQDWQPDVLKRVRVLLNDTLQQLSDCGVKVLLKNHPRYNNCISLDDIYSQYDFVEETRESLLRLQEKTLLHVTLNSTTAFEFAAAGIPSYFMCSNKEEIPFKHLFYDEYKYPLFRNMSIKEIISTISDKRKYEELKSIIRKWYYYFYSPFNETDFVNLIK